MLFETDWNLCIMCAKRYCWFYLPLDIFWQMCSQQWAAFRVPPDEIQFSKATHEPFPLFLYTSLWCVRVRALSNRDHIDNLTSRGGDLLPWRSKPRRFTKLQETAIGWKRKMCSLKRINVHCLAKLLLTQQVIWAKYLLRGKSASPSYFGQWTAVGALLLRSWSAISLVA